MSNSPVKILELFAGYFKDLFFPSSCLHCQTILSSPADKFPVCQNCCSELILMPPDLPKRNILDRLEKCYLDQIWIAYQFNEIIQSVIHHIKYSKMPNLGIQTGELAANVLKTHFDSIPAKHFLPVPLHTIREKERGYNQSKFISKGIINVHSGTLLENVLIRNKNTISQTTLNREERQENVHQAFGIKNKYEIRGKTIILVDDLITTGATINECSRVLKENEAQQVIGVAVASPINLTAQSF